MRIESRYEIGNKKVFNPPSSFILSDVLSLPFLSLLCLGLGILFLGLLTINLLIQDPVNLRYWKGTFFSNLLWHIFTTREYALPRSVLSDTGTPPAAQSQAVLRPQTHRCKEGIRHSGPQSSVSQTVTCMWITWTAKMQILIPGVWEGAWVSAFPLSSRVMPRLLSEGQPLLCSLWASSALAPTSGGCMREAKEAGSSKAHTALWALRTQHSLLRQPQAGFQGCFLWRPAVLSRSGRVWLFATPWTVAHQAPLSMGFPRQEYWSGLAISSSRRSSRPRDWTHISSVSGTGQRVLHH